MFSEWLVGRKDPMIGKKGHRLCSLMWLRRREAQEWKTWDQNGETGERAAAVVNHSM